MRDDDPVAPSLDDFERMAGEAFEALPAAFRARCENVAIGVADFADDETLESFGMESPYELTGLYHGVDLTQKSHFDTPDGPDRVWLYRLPILLEWCERGDVGLREIIGHVLVHEIGHHFGLTDEEIEAIEAKAD